MKTIFKELDEVFVGFYHKFISDEDTDSKMISLLSCIYFGTNATGECTASIEHLVRKMGYKPDRNKGKINDKVIGLLEELEIHNYIFILPKSLRDTKNTEIFTIQINLDNDIFYVDKKFVQLTYEEYIKIISSDSKLNKSTMLRIFLNIKKHWTIGDKSSYSHPTYRTLSNECNVSNTTQVISYIEDLKDIGLLPYSYCSGSYTTKKESEKEKNAFMIFSRAPIDPQKADIYTINALNLDKNTKFNSIAKPGAKIKRDKLFKEREEAERISYKMEIERLDNKTDEFDDYE